MKGGVKEGRELKMGGVREGGLEMEGVREGGVRDGRS